MKNQYTAVHYKTSPEKADIISALLLDAGFDGVEDHHDEHIASIRKELLDEAWLHELMQARDVAYTLETIEEQNWNAEWEAGFEPVIVGSFAAIRASFHAAPAGVGHDIIITPKMSFGTGHHATTYLMIEQMQSIAFSNKTVIDFGTGTGVLAIIAEKLGALKVFATDNDEWSIHNAKENIEANGCRNIQLLLADNLPEENLPTADIILANINLNVIIANLAALQAVAVKGATVLFSGLMTADEQKISYELQANNFHIKKVEHKNGWICLCTTYS